MRITRINEVEIRSGAKERLWHEVDGQRMSKERTGIARFMLAHEPGHECNPVDVQGLEFRSHLDPLWNFQFLVYLFH